MEDFLDGDMTEEDMYGFTYLDWLPKVYVLLEIEPPYEQIRYGSIPL